MVQDEREADVHRACAGPEQPGTVADARRGMEEDARRREDRLLGEAQHGAGGFGLGRHVDASAAAPQRRRSRLSSETGAAAMRLPHFERTIGSWPTRSHGSPKR